MAWKLKKWKGSEAEEEQAPEDGYDITDAATPQEEYAAPQPPAFAQPEPAQAFNSNDLSQELFAQQGPAEAIATPPPSAPSVIPLGPADLEAEVAPPPIDTSAEDAPEPVQAAPVHELDSEVETSPSPIDFSPQADQEIDSESPDYFAQSVASAHEAVTQFEQISSEPAMQEEDEPIAFELDTPGQALSGLHAQPTLVEPEDIAPAPPPAPQAPPPPASANTLDAFAPYQPAATAAVDNGRGG
ncbi:MAG TPA: hypothetical protein VFW40_13230, partial [Capsulimonadaceae bacterium]|nr:hypothetical protein [Capsulimonadaceae bacterium]